jgi:hypothetical protein
MICCLIIKPADTTAVSQCLRNAGEVMKQQKKKRVNCFVPSVALKKIGMPQSRLVHTVCFCKMYRVLHGWQYAIVSKENKSKNGVYVHMVHTKHNSLHDTSLPTFASLMIRLGRALQDANQASLHHAKCLFRCSDSFSYRFY